MTSSKPHRPMTAEEIKQSKEALKKAQDTKPDDPGADKDKPAGVINTRDLTS